VDNPILRAIQALAGHQATDLHLVYTRLGGEGDPDLMPSEVRQFLCRLLQTFGYRERWVTKGDGEAHLMWVRDPWPVDVAALSGEVETYTSAE
jgi:hypothetical protein